MTYEEAVQSIPCGRYRHFKGNEYEVIGIARHSETEEPMVVYRPSTARVACGHALRPCGMRRSQGMGRHSGGLRLWII